MDKNVSLQNSVGLSNVFVEERSGGKKQEYKAAIIFERDIKTFEVASEFKDEVKKEANKENVGQSAKPSKSITNLSNFNKIHTKINLQNDHFYKISSFFRYKRIDIFCLLRFFESLL